MRHLLHGDRFFAKSIATAKDLKSFMRFLLIA